MQGFSVDLRILATAARTWDDLADQVAVSGRRLRTAEGDADSLGAAVAGRVRSWMGAWERVATRQSSAAQGHANALSKIRTAYDRLDEQSAAELSAALPWSHRAAGLVEGEAPPIVGGAPLALPLQVAPGSTVAPPRRPGPQP